MSNCLAGRKKKKTKLSKSAETFISLPGRSCESKSGAQGEHYLTFSAVLAFFLRDTECRPASLTHGGVTGNGRSLKERVGNWTRSLFSQNWMHHISSYSCCLIQSGNFCQPPLINLAIRPMVGWLNSQTLNSGITRRVAFPKHPQPQLKSCIWFGFPQMALLLTLIKHRKNKTAI